jgi:hypothetical protein
MYGGKYFHQHVQAMIYPLYKYDKRLKIKQMKNEMCYKNSIAVVTRKVLVHESSTIVGDLVEIGIEIFMFHPFVYFIYFNE